MHNFIFILFVFLISNISLTANERFKQQPAIIFAASNLKSIFPKLVENFYIKHPNARILIQYGASGRLAQSIIEGVYCDLFYSADMKYPQKVFKKVNVFIEPKPYIKGNLILFSYFDLSEKKLNILEDKRVNNITLANKLSAPYGKAAIQVLENLKILDSVEYKIRFSSDIFSAINNVVWSGDSAILSKASLSMLPKEFNIENRYWMDIDSSLYNSIIQGYTVSKDSLKNQNVINFINFISSKDAEDIFVKYGYSRIYK